MRVPWESHGQTLTDSSCSQGLLPRVCEWPGSTVGLIARSMAQAGPQQGYPIGSCHGWHSVPQTPGQIHGPGWAMPGPPCWTSLCPDQCLADAWPIGGPGWAMPGSFHRSSPWPGQRAPDAWPDPWSRLGNARVTLLGFTMAWQVSFRCFWGTPCQPG